MPPDSSEVTINNVVNFSYFDAINRRFWDQRYSFDNFNTNPVTSKVGGGAALGSAGSNNAMVTRFGLFEWFVIGTQTVLAPSIDTFGLNLAMTGTTGQGLELCQGVTPLSVAAFIVGTDAPFYIRTEFKISTIVGCNPLLIGFRKAQAFNATLATYTDFACIGINSTSSATTVVTETQQTTGGVVITNTTNVVTDGSVLRFAVFVDAQGNVSYTLNDSPPVVVVAYQFTNGLTLIPFIRFTEGSSTSSQVSCDWYECGFTQEPFIA